MGMTTNHGAARPRFAARVVVDLDTAQADPFYIIGEVRRAMKEAGATARQANAFNRDVVAGDYNHMLDVVERWVAVEWKGRDPRVMGERA